MAQIKDYITYSLELLGRGKEVHFSSVLSCSYFGLCFVRINMGSFTDKFCCEGNC